MFRAAFSSRSSTSPQQGQTWVRTLKDLSMRSPQPLHSWLVYCAGTATTRFPAHAGVKMGSPCGMRAF